MSLPSQLSSPQLSTDYNAEFKRNAILVTNEIRMANAHITYIRGKLEFLQSFFENYGNVAINADDHEREIKLLFEEHRNFALDIEAMGSEIEGLTGEVENFRWIDPEKYQIGIADLIDLNLDIGGKEGIAWYAAIIDPRNSAGRPRGMIKHGGLSTMTIKRILKQDILDSDHRKISINTNLRMNTSICWNSQHDHQSIADLKWDREGECNACCAAKASGKQDVNCFIFVSEVDIRIYRPRR
ncbi:hypothetical protein BTUL_0313g00080 [Botrytis tulipae]|uniref:Uncharacterized protein n=1 Tax=Botrytis tulipae TaxID=87230 RepID=A0A4Z1ECT3_9HELO|nr:hypothetical protein BTUL_0313g00080 [Botrytis tulipae]